MSVNVAHSQEGARSSEDGFKGFHRGEGGQESENVSEVGAARWGKIKIPVWPAVNLRLLTAQRSCCVTGFLMTLQQPLPQIALT